METKKVTTDQNQVKIGAGTRVRNVIRYSTMLFKERNFREIHFSAIGGSIGSLVNVLEVLRTVHPNLYQNNRISTVSYQTVDSNGKIIQERLYPKLESTLSYDEPTEKGEGYQGVLTDEERNKLLELLNNRRERPDRREHRDNYRTRDVRDRESSRRGRGRGFGGRGRGFGGRGRGFGGRGSDFGGRGRGFGGRGRGFGGRGSGFGGRGSESSGRGFFSGGRGFRSGPRGRGFGGRR